MSEQQLFRWQSAAQALYLSRLQKDFLLVAVPGAGKTFWTMHTARELLKAGRIQRIVVVVPTSELKNQWAQTAHKVGLNIEPDYQNSDGAWPVDAEGVSMTYGQMYTFSDLHRANVARRPTLVILDEVHHLRETTGWGQRAQEAFDMAAYRIHLSGTPWNKEGFIPWVTYDPDGKVRADETYTYMDSLTDGVNCDVFFPAKGARTEWDFDGKVFRHSFEDVLDEKNRARRLNTALAVPESDYIPETFRQADAELTRIRAIPGQDRSGGLIIARDIFHARAMAPVLRAPGAAPIPVVASDDRESSRIIKNFRHSTDRWLISVKMVSEGVDIPRLRVMIFATNVTTRLFFRQAVGRVIRGSEPPAVVYIPKDPVLVSLAKEFRDERIDALKQAEQKIEDADEAERVEREPSTYKPVRGETFEDGVIHASGDVTQLELEFAASAIQAAGGQPTVANKTLTAKILREHGRGGQSPQEPPAPDAPIQSERKRALRETMNKMIQNHCFVTGEDYAAVNADLNVAVGVRRLRDCSEEQLRKRLDLTKERCRRR